MKTPSRVFSQPFALMVAILLLTASSLLAQQQSAPAAIPASQGSQSPNIVIGAGDLLNIVVFDTPELTTSVRVSQDGEVNLPVLGTMKLAGMTTIEAARSIENELRSRGLILEPHVTIFVAEYASQGATVLGEVKTPGIYPTLGTRKMLDMLALAGGLQTTAGKSVSIIHRSDPQHPTVIPLQVSPANMAAQENPTILPGDTLVVTKAGIVYVIGDVLKPGGFLVDNNTPISVMQALSLAGGWDKTAALSKTKLIRKIGADREEMDLDLKHIAYGSQADLKVRDGDIIFVPSSISKTMTYRGIEAAISITSGVLIYLH